MLSTKYEPNDTENKWYAQWLEHKCFASVPDHREPYTVVIPPPNVTGVLHMGHMLNNTIQDVLVRRARMKGFNACWVPGTDHASIATEAKVVQLLATQGIAKKDISREAFLQHAFEWKQKYGDIILSQLQKIGISADWDRTRFTMEPKLSQAVTKVFVDLYQKNHIYKGVRMINWDPQGKTALSDEEVIFTEEQSKLYYVKYKISQAENEYIVVATARPETIMGDVAICVHPDDPRYQHLVGKTCIVPLINREIPIIADEYITMDFGTGCLKVTPAHDINDYNLGLKHKLAVIDTLNDDGTMSEAAQIYVGEDRFVVRKKIAKELQTNELIEKIEDYQNKVGRSERTNAVVEPRLSLQWFLKMEALAKPALDAVMNDEIRLHPAKFKNTYKHWLENVRDWCISRQLWWGQQIPAYYLPNGEIIVAETKEIALGIANQNADKKYTEQDLTQDPDVVDTWFSSWLWPISVFDGFGQAAPNEPLKADGAELNYYYPTQDLVTAPEILFFWVARMVIAGYEYTGKKPFENVYLTGIVRDKLGRKMSKSLGNSPDPLELIQKYGADGVRLGMLICSPAGNDLPFDQSYCEQGRNFSNKLWNAFRLVKNWQIIDGDSPQNNIAIAYMRNRMAQVIAQTEADYAQYRLSEALMNVYKLIWDDYCANYLEMIKPAYEQPIDRATYQATIDIFEQLLKILHPFMPFITEELWQNTNERKSGEFLMLEPYPKTESYDKNLIDETNQVLELISSIRNLRAQKQISPKEALNLQIDAEENGVFDRFSGIISKLAHISEFALGAQVPSGYTKFMVNTYECYLDLGNKIDVAAEKERLQKEIEYQKGFLESVERKLSNEKFVGNAPDSVLQNERNKQADAQHKIKALEIALQNLL